MAHPLTSLLGRAVTSGAGRLQPGGPGTEVPDRPALRAFSGRRPVGPLAFVLQPVGLVLALLLLILGLAWLGTGTVRSWLRHADYAEPVHADSSVMLPPPARQVADVVTLTVRDSAGDVRRLEIDRVQLSAFVADRIAGLEADRAAAAAALRQEVRQRFSEAFSDGDLRIRAFADWYFAWGRSWALLWEAASSAARHAAGTGVETLDEAVRRDMTDYYRRHFTEQVLRPEYRDWLVQEAIRDAITGAHQRFAAAVTREDGELARFLATHTSHLTAHGTGPVRLDWDAQRWKAPTFLIEDKGAEGLQSLLTVGGSTWMGSALGPVISRLVAEAFAPAATRIAARAILQTEAAGSGGTLGSVLPGIGTVGGAVAGFALGTGVDYLLSKGREWAGRDAFEAANRDALQAVRDAWAAKADEEIGRALDVWFDDARAALLTLQQQGFQTRSR
ncbi:hypothetical protein [Paracraurococcus lichenis]|uniref:Uncharacterized protein n=1 Tax=Paracraurococcus lichenis TaxID=3064888 RepID=A0ABT9E928_9PROT|nr:hypothetical protein [Paracraurococcus sp. LOR1-02]MDO9712690.1 hypothetical protein [Paracraurococcus sp. LOR1-02]